MTENRTDNIEDNKNDIVSFYDNIIEYLLDVKNEISIVNDKSEPIDIELILTNYKNETIINKESRCQNFYKLLKDNRIFIPFSKSKVKAFSHKTEINTQLSHSLFDSILSLKNLLNNQDNNIKQKLWMRLFGLYILLDNVNKSDNKERVKILKKKILKIGNINTKNKLLDMCGNDLNDDTNGMIDEILQSFEKFSNNDINKSMENILNISKNITEKYYDKINNGDIDLTKIVKGFSNKIPGLDKLLDKFNENEEDKSLTIIDENFSTALVTIPSIIESTNNDFNIKDIMNLVNNLNLDKLTL